MTHSPERVGEQACILGEGALWHPDLNLFFWFDIKGNRLHCEDGRVWEFDENVSAAGCISDTELLIASESSLFRFNLETGSDMKVVGLEADDATTRSNDGRADPWGGFWIGTMSKTGDPDQGTIYRYHNGQLRQLFAPISIPNAMCFDKARSVAFFTDTPHRRILRQPLRARDGWPEGKATTYRDFSDTGELPDGAVLCADGTMLVALYGAGAIAHLAPDGSEITRFKFPASQTTCPAMGGTNLSTLYVTSAFQNLTTEQRDTEPDAGWTFRMSTDLQGMAEPKVLI